MPKLSVVIPVYNVENYLRKCIDSVLYENLEDYEIVIVNDGSTDSSPEICREYALRYPGLIRLISTPNGGLGAARNVGIGQAKGEFLLFLDSDDTLSENALPEIMEALQEDVDICIFDFVNVTEDGRSLGRVRGCEREGCFSLEEYPELLFCPPNAWCKLWKRSMFTDFGIAFPGRVWFEDLHTTPKLYTHARRICYVPKGWYQYLQRAGSITKNKNPQRCLEIIGAVDSTVDYFREKGLFPRYREELEYMALYHQVITSTTRVSMIDWKSPVQKELYRNYAEKFPDYRENRYVKAMPVKLKLLLFYIEHGLYLPFHLTMRLNDIVKGK